MGRLRRRRLCDATKETNPAAVGPVAQWLEPAAHNRLVGGSSPSGPTIQSHESRAFLTVSKTPPYFRHLSRCGRQRLATETQVAGNIPRQAPLVSSGHFRVQTFPVAIARAILLLRRSACEHALLQCPGEGQVGDARQALGRQELRLRPRQDRFGDRGGEEREG
jgi:hypothetical protein